MDNNTFTLNVKFDNLTGGQVLALRYFFELMQTNGEMGHSEWMAFYADGDGNFHPTIKTSIESNNQKFQEIDKHLPILLNLMDNDGRNREINNKNSTFVDFDLYEWYYEEPHMVNISKFLERHKDDQIVQQILNYK